MYKLLLCLRYLHTRYLAFVCIVSVMLGVATLIVVNSVMSGFSTKLKDRIHGVLSDVRVGTDRADGFEQTTPQLEARIATSPMGKHIEAMSPIIDTIAIMQYSVRDRFGRKIPMTQQVKLCGVDPARQAKVGGFAEYLVRQKDSPNPSFELSTEARLRFEQTRSLDMDNEFRPVPKQNAQTQPPPANDPAAFLKLPEIEPLPVPIPPPVIPPPNLGPPPPPRMPGIILGHSLAHYLDKATNEERAMLLPGDEVLIATLSGTGTKPVMATFIVADFIKTGMTEYDSNLVYVPLEDLQRIRGVDDHVNSIQIKLKPDVRGDSQFVHSTFVPKLQEEIPVPESRVMSWEQQQGPLLAAIDIERSILNVLLFLIVGVAGFGVLAIFSMIVSEKYRDIGIMKALGASSSGVMAIFLGYGFLLGVVGCGLGTALGLWFTWNINMIEAWLSRRTGTKVFDRSTYYFDQIPTNVEASNVGWINLGALAIAVAFSVLPALRAARLQPIRALRFE